MKETKKEPKMRERERLLRPLKWLETKEGTQDDGVIIVATKMVRNQRGNAR
jgi:hypothetical protein